MKIYTEATCTEDGFRVSFFLLNLGFEMELQCKIKKELKDRHKLRRV